MRRITACLFIVASATLIGCVDENRQNAEKILDQTNEEFHQLADYLEKGEKNGVDGCITRLIALGKLAKTTKLKPADAQAMAKRKHDMMEEVKKLVIEARKKASTSGKFTPAELQDIDRKFDELNK